MDWKIGDRLSHRHNPDLGPGWVLDIDGRTLVVRFPESDEDLRISAGSDAIEPLVVEPGSRARLLTDGSPVTVAARLAGARVRLEDGREVAEQEIWPLPTPASLVDRLARGKVDPLDAFSLRLEALHLAAVREADGLGSFLGGRIRIFPHQLYAAERATRTDPVRWLLADEVGLGKTVEACLILNHLVRTGRADRALVIAPDTLTVQWLGELWRKYHQVFVLLDEKRLADVERDYGAGFNPFEAHRMTVVSLELLQDRPRLTEQAALAGIDLVIVDEAHHLRRPEGHPGNRAYRAVRPLADLGRHLLLLTATPLEEDAHGFFRLLQMLRPEELPEDSFAERLAARRPLPACTSSTRRADIGGLPPRKPAPVPVEDDPERAALLARLRAAPAANAAARRAKLDRVRRACSSGAALLATPGLDDEVTRRARGADRRDPRLSWLADQAPGWARRGQKTLVFVEGRETLDLIRTAMSRRIQLRVGVFHEDLSSGQRDIEVAQFRLESGPSMLVSTECGGEGRNFEFCTRIVLFDLPWNPAVVEQRIGRLDRIGRRIPVEIVYFRPADDLTSEVARLYESIGLFEEPLGGAMRELALVEPAIENLAADPAADPAVAFDGVVREARAGRDRIREAAYQELHRDPFRPAAGASILARLPEDLDEQTESVVLAAADRLELNVESHRDGMRYSIEHGHGARVESLPGVPPGSSWLGTFDREEAVRDEGIDFFASGHPLVEGILEHLEESPEGRVALIHGKAPAGVAGGLGVLALYKNGPRFEARALDAEGNERPEWAEALTRLPLRSRRIRPESWTEQPGWPEFVRSLGRALESHGRPVAVAAVRLDEPVRTERSSRR